jgi:2-desacetyl-2-hydroxyethyl bacteriochlorophyllide A dehydrogenase
MRASIITGPNRIETIEVPTPVVGHADILVRIRACGLCGSDAFYLAIGGLPPRQGRMPIGHEAAGEIVDIGPGVRDLEIGDRVVINPMAMPSDIIGNGGATGALADFLLVRDAVRGTSVEVVPATIPFEVAALNEPMAVARHVVNQVKPVTTDKALVFGAGPIGLGATIALKSLGVNHVVVADIVGSRLEKALKVGADAVINSADADLRSRLTDLHGPGESQWPGKAGTDVYLDAAGVPAVIATALDVAKRGARIGVVAIHKEPVAVDFMNVMANELTIIGSMGYPTEIFEVTSDLVDRWETYATIISHRYPYDSVGDALRCAATPGAADKVIVTFDRPR